MSIVFSASSIQSIGGSSGVKTFSHTFAGPGAAVLIAGDADATNPPTAVDVNGVALTLVDSAIWTVGAHRGAWVWAVASGITAGTHDVHITVASSSGNERAMAVDVSASLLAIGDHDAESNTSLATYMSLTSSLAHARGLGVMVLSGSSGGGAGTGNTLFASTEPARWFGFCYETAAAASGTRSVGFSGNGIHAGAVMLFEEVAPSIEPDVAGASVGIPDSFEVTQGDPVIYANPFGIVAAKVGIPSGFAVTATGPAQVLLAVPTKERPQTTEGGTEGYVLTYHTARKPTWEPGGSDTTSLVIDTASGTYDIDAAVALTHEITLTDATELTPVGTSAADEAIDLRLVLFPEGETVTWGGTILWAGGTAPDLTGLSTGESAVIGFLSTDQGVKWRGFLADGDGATALEPGEAGDITTLDFGDAPAAGATGKYADAGHRHGMPEEPEGGGGGGELDYVQITSPVSVTATSEATANTVITANPVAFDGSTDVEIEVCSPQWYGPATATADIQLALYDGSSSTGMIASMRSETTSRAVNTLSAKCRVTPTAGTHTFSARGWCTAGSGAVQAGAGGSGNMRPAFMRIVAV